MMNWQVPKSAGQGKNRAVHYAGFRKGWQVNSQREFSPSQFYLVLNNLQPIPEGVRVRKGYRTQYQLDGRTYLGGFHGSIDGKARLFASTEDGLFDISTLPLPVLKSSDKASAWVSTQFSNSAGGWICAVNGSKHIYLADAAELRKDGEGGIPVLSVSDTTEFPEVPNLSHILNYKGRLYFAAKGTLDLAYLAPRAVSGELSLFAVGQNCSRGGSIAGLGNWTVDAGTNIEDYMLVMTTEGELLIYRGIDPASDITLAGVYQLAKPLGLSPFVSFGSDTLILTIAGVISLKAVLNGTVYEKDVYMTNGFKFVLQEHIKLTASNPKWRMYSIPAEGLLVINAPLFGVEGKYIQYVFDSLTQQWATYSGLDVSDMLVTTGGVYGLAGQKFIAMFSGYSDDGEHISFKLLTSFSAFNSPANRKRISLGRPRYEAVDLQDIHLSYPVDMDASQPTNTIDYSFMASLWDEALWDVDVWEGRETYQQWLAGLTGFGFYIAVWFEAKTRDDFVWRGIDLYYETGTSI